MEVIDQIEPHKSLEHQDQLLSVLKMNKVCSRTKPRHFKFIACFIKNTSFGFLIFEAGFEQEKVQVCYNLVVQHSKAYGNGFYHSNNPHKRKHEQQAPDSPSGVIDAGFSSDSSNDSWALRAASVCSSPEPSFKKSKTEEPKMKFHSLNRVFLDIVGSPS